MSRRLLLISRWRLETTRERLWELLGKPADWPAWWPHLVGVTRLADGDAEGIGARHAFRWRSGLGYRLLMVITSVRSDPCRELEGQASGDLHGIGLWVITEDGPGAVRLTYRWDVELRKAWMRRLAFVLLPVFAWRHFAVMRSGARGMARRLGCRLSQVEEWSAITPEQGLRRARGSPAR